LGGFKRKKGQGDKQQKEEKRGGFVWWVLGKEGKQKSRKKVGMVVVVEKAWGTDCGMAPPVWFMRLHQQYLF
jgi:hypothetical protein